MLIAVISDFSRAAGVGAMPTAAGCKSRAKNVDTSWRDCLKSEANCAEITRICSLATPSRGNGGEKVPKAKWS